MTPSTAPVPSREGSPNRGGLSEEEFAKYKALHGEVHRYVYAMTAKKGAHHRYALLIWAFVRGIPYRRIERNHRMQPMPDGSTFEHGKPVVYLLLSAFLEAFKPAFSGPDRWNLLKGDSAGALAIFNAHTPDSLRITAERITAWVSDPAGAIPAPAARVKTKLSRESQDALRVHRHEGLADVVDAVDFDRPLNTITGTVR